jgi:crossover junction endodeoxyribonuclease RusA
MCDYEFELPYPPSVNGYWRAFRNRQIISKRGREYRAEAVKAMQLQGMYEEGVSDRLSVSLTLHPPTLRKYDIDNFCKASFDALSHAGFWVDDEQVDQLSIKKGEKVKGGKLVVKVTKL